MNRAAHGALGVLCTLAVLPGFEPNPVCAQGVTTAAIAGVVADDSGRGLESADIEVVNRGTGFVARAGSRAGGRYLVQGLEPGGPYSVVVRRIGFQAQARDRVQLALGQVLRLDFALTIAVTEVPPLTVEANEGPGFLRSPIGVGAIISDSLLRRLPTPNRDLYGLVALVPQMSTSFGPSGGGVNFRFNSILIDGVSDQGFYGSNAAGAVWGGKAISQEAVREYQVLLSPYDVRLGGFAGALINAVTRSGTNQLHGTAFIYGRSDRLARTPPTGSGYNRSQFGFGLGGPVVRDRIHFYIASEFQRLAAPAFGPYVGQDPSAAMPVPAAAYLDRFVGLLESKGLHPGSAGLVPTDNPLVNVFGRLDFTLPGLNSRLVLRYNYSRADSQAFSRPDPAANFSCGSPGCFPLSSLSRQQVVTKQATSASLYSALKGGAGNELILGYNTVPLRITAGVQEPLVRVMVPNAAATGFAVLEAGAVEFAQGNRLDQQIFEVTDNLTFPRGAHRFRVGARGEFYRLGLLQLRGSLGVWSFSSLDSLQHDTAATYALVRDLGGADAKLRGADVAAYAGDEWELSRHFTLTYGLRIDVPVVTNRPPYDALVDSLFDRRTDIIPSGYALWSPRVGFRWEAGGNGRSQLRGGFGLFTGRPPLAWLINAFANYGGGVGVLQCGRRPTDAGPAPPFVADYLNAPTTCANGGGFTAGSVNLVDGHLSFPTTLRASLAYDRQLPWGIEATVEGLYTKNLNDFFFVNRNLKGPVGVDRFGRTLYGGIDSTGAAIPSLVTKRFSQVIDVVNQSHNYSYNATAQLRKHVGDDLELAGAFSYSRARDVQTLLSVAAFDAWQFGRALSGPHDDERSGVSGFEQAQRVVITATYRLPWRRWQTELSVLYLGEAGFPFTYLANRDPDPRRGDLNADGTNKNDPIYIPNNVYDTTEVRFAAPGVAAQQAAFETFIDSSPCLQSQRGQFMRRNSCRSAWRNTLNLSVRQTLPLVHGQGLLLELDMFNFLNLLNSQWGQLKVPNTALLAQVGQTPGPPLQSQPVFRFDQPFARYNAQSGDAGYQVQLAARYSF